MRSIIRKAVFMSIGVLFAFEISLAQTNIPLLGFTQGVGARAIGMGGAFVAIADDYSATFWNPAGLGQIRRMELTGSYNSLSYENNTSYYNSPFSDKTNFSNLNSIGFVFPVPTYRGSMVFAFGYNRIANYNSNFIIQGFNSSSDDSVFQSASQLDRGGLRQWVAAGSVQLSKHLYLGGSFNIYAGDYDYAWDLNETDDLDLYEEDTWIFQDDINTSISGVGMTFALLYNVNNRIKFGATIESPVTFRGKEEWRAFERVDYDDNTFYDSTSVGEYEYKIRQPLKVNFGVSLALPLLTVSGGLSFSDWSQLEYTDPTDLEVDNRDFAKNLQSTTQYRAGAELILPGTNTRVRAGYLLDPTPYKINAPYTDKEFYTAGIGFLIDRQFTLDIGAIFGKWETFEPGTLREEIKTVNYTVSASFRF